MKKKSDLELTPGSFTGTPKLRELMAKAQQHSQAEQMVIAAIPSNLAAGTRFVSCDNGELVLSATTAINASQIRFRQHDIMTELRKQALFRFVWKLRIKVSPSRFSEREKLAITPLSNENARLLREEAGHTKDKHLREVLEKLASHVRS